MKKPCSPLLLVILLTLAIMFIAQPAFSAIRAVFIGGQSNAVGVADLTKLPAWMKEIPSNVRFFTTNGQSLFTDFEHFGPEVTLSWHLSRAYPDDEIWIIKFARGGTTMLAWKPRWTYDEARLGHDEAKGPLYKDLVKFIKDTIRDAEIEWLGAIWIQGENDSCIKYAAYHYLSNISSFIRHLRVDLRARPLKFYLAPTTSNRRYADIVREADKEVAQGLSGVRLVHTSDLATMKLPDGVHYGVKAQRILGRRLAQRIISDNPAR
jgi:hypothetical protein